MGTWPTTTTHEAGFTLVATPGGDDRPCYVEFKVYKIASPAEYSGELCYEKAESDLSWDTTDATADARVFLEGTVKFDGCANLQFHPNDQNLCLHFCDEDEAASLGDLMRAMYRIAKAAMREAWCG